MVDRETRASGKRNTSLRGDLRSEFARDTDRFSYNQYWHRLAEITQVYSAGTTIERLTESRPTHNRLTHSQKVAQVGKRLAQYLLADDKNLLGIVAAGSMDPDVVEAACMAHDLGHPPFGHRGEEELDRLARVHGLEDGFEGNAQTFRVITRLSQHSPVSSPDCGMDLTAATLTASVKYPWPRDREEGSDGYASNRWHKFGFYDDDAETFNGLVGPLLKRPGRKSLEAQVMDWADDISYAVHDVEDFYKLGLIPLERLQHRDVAPKGHAPQYELVGSSSRDKSEFLGNAIHRLLGKSQVPAEKLADYFAEYATLFPESAYEGRRLQDGVMDTFASTVITDSSKATSVDASGILRVEPKMRGVIDILQQLTWHYVIERPALVQQQAGQISMLGTVFEHILYRASRALSRSESDPLTGKIRKVSAEERWNRRRTLPVRLNEFLEQSGADLEELEEEIRHIRVVRGVVDYVSALTEKDVVRYTETLAPH